ncbi:MAG: hypothetical protein EOO24_47260 [Comamonadaceae bacterium]|nr:MAG: hypothetical protein EOO24_47260 [Comamonadaceae bacterium]
MLRLFLACLCAAASYCAQAQDPLKSSACDQRLDALRAARIAGAPANAERLETLRRQATQACLGGTGAATRPSPVLQAPIVVAPPVIEPSRPATPPVPLPAPPAVAIERPAVITACDAGGCWDSNGTRLDRAGPLLLGPSGACTTVGATVRCP